MPLDSAPTIESMHVSYLGDYIRHLVISKPDVHHSARKIFFNRTLTMPGNIAENYELSAVGYATNKERQLIRNYWNKESAEKALHELESHLHRSDYSVGWHCHGEPKPGKTSQAGYCIQAMTLVRRNDHFRLNVFYRTVEISKKFYADLHFIENTVIPHFKVRPNIITCYFSSVTLNNLYLPLIARMISHTSWETDLLTMKDYDPKFFYSMTKWAHEYLRDAVFPYAEMRRMKTMVDKRNLRILRWLDSRWVNKRKLTTRST